LKNKNYLFIFFIIIILAFMTFVFCTSCNMNFNNTLNSKNTQTNNTNVTESSAIIPSSSTTSKSDDAQNQNNTNFNNSNLLNFRGIDFYPYPIPYSNKDCLQSLSELLNIKEINYIQIRFFIYQSKINSNEITMDESQDQYLINLINLIHKNGKKVSLMPHLIVDNDKVWSGYIKPTNEKLWFQSYTDAILHYAKIADDENVELFPIANELVSISGNNAEWKAVIKAVRNVYKGKITAKINRWYQESQFQDILKMGWLGDLDYIGIAAYFDLTQKPNPTLEELKNSWENNRQGLNIVQELEAISNKFNKNIIFLEIGYRSILGANIEPWSYGTKIPNANNTNSSTSNKSGQQEQANATQALFDVFNDKSWFDGVFWFYWPTKITYDPNNDTSWSIPGKTVEKIILENFQKARN